MKHIQSKANIKYFKIMKTLISINEYHKNVIYFFSSAAQLSVFSFVTAFGDCILFSEEPINRGKSTSKLKPIRCIERLMIS